MDKLAKTRDASPDITEAPSIYSAIIQQRLEAVKIEQNKNKDETETEVPVAMPSAPEEVKKKRGRPRKNPLPPTNVPKDTDDDLKIQKSKIKGRQPKVVINKLKEPLKEELKDEDVTQTEGGVTIINTQSDIDIGDTVKKEITSDPVPAYIPEKDTEASDSAGVSSIFNVKIEPTFGPGYIPGLDLVNDSSELEKPLTDVSENVLPNISKSSALCKEKKTEAPTETKDKQNEDESDNKIRRSSRIKTLEEQRGSRGRRREVVFSTVDQMPNASRNSIVANDDDSNSNGSNSMFGSSFSSPTHDGSNSSIPSSFPNSTTTNQFPGISSASLSSSNGSLKPQKLKSRWRYSLDAENMKSESNNGNSLDMQFLSMSSDNPMSDSLSTPSGVENQNNVELYLKERKLIRRSGHIIHEASDLELIEKLKKFEGLDDNLFKSGLKIGKEGRGMVCDCVLTKEDIMRGEIGCNEDCLNRLLMVECGSRCPTGERCTNRRFQRKEYCLLEVFQTEKKGHGLRTLQPLPYGGFVIEYVGEVLDARLFRHRIKDYAKGNQEHFYFMALKSDAIIDATLKGNCSRFINHSCDPNCETQKWTVNGELRIGFFATRELQAGEEITFDYQFQRYGKKAQRCFCMAENCRGWIGGDEEDENVEPNEAAETQLEVEQELDREKLKEKPRIERKKRKDGQLGDMAFDEELGKLETSGLKNRHHTLTLSRLMVRAEDWEIKERLLKILLNGDTPCRRLFLDYHGLRLIWSWMVDLPLPVENADTQLIINDKYHMLFLKALRSLPIPNKSLLQDSKVLTLMEKWSQAPQYKAITSAKPDNSEATSKLAKPMDVKIADSSEAEVKSEPSDKSQDVKVSPESTVNEPTVDKSEEVESTETNRGEQHWKFVEETRTVLESWADLKEVFRIPKKERVEQMKEHEREADKGMKESSVSMGYERESRKHRSKGERRVHVIDSSQHISYHRNTHRDRNLGHPNLSKEERRLIFAAKVAREELEDKQRKAQDHMVNLHQDRCAALGLDAATTPIVDPSGSYYLDPKTISWIAIKLDDPNLPPELIPLLQPSLYPPQEVFEMLAPEPEFEFPPWPDGLPPPPPLPPTTLPPRWKMAVDDEGRCYYYDIKTRHTQWYPPSPESSEGYGSLSNSSSESDEVEEEETVEDSTPSEAQIHFQTKRSKLNERAEKRKKAGLVQERIISPRLEDERPSISQKSIRARKQALMEEKLKKLQEAEGIALVQAAESGVDVEMSPDRVPVKEKHSSRSHGVPVKRRRKESSRHLVQSKSKSSSKRIKSSHTSESQNLDLSEMLVPESEFETPEAPKKSDKDEGGAPNVDSIIDIPTDTPANDMIPGFMTDEERAAMAAANSSSASSSKKSDRSKTGEKERKRHHAGHKKERDKDSSSSDKRNKDATKESFRNQIANVIVMHLNPYRKSDCKNGRIISTDDFKHLARKMTHAILLKELKHTRDAKTLEVNDSVRHKTKEYVKKFMARFPNSSYVRSPEDTQEK